MKAAPPAVRLDVVVPNHQVDHSAALNIAAKDRVQRRLIALSVAITKWRTERGAVGMPVNALDHTEHMKPMVIGVDAITNRLTYDDYLSNQEEVQPAQ